MKTYCVRMVYDCYADFTVEAENEEEAMKKAEQMKRMIRSRSWKEWQESLVVNFREYEVYEE
ncbi:MAG: hypothetical protein MR793_02615 [Bacteroidales bacterium]|nr:hypothetical protein [Bacteroidales bacterium]